MELFANCQWGVTEDGMESRHPDFWYEVDADRLTEITERIGVTYYDWPLHMAEKTWVDINAFNEAFRAALNQHKGKYEPAADAQMLKVSIEKSIRDARVR